MRIIIVLLMSLFVSSAFAAKTGSSVLIKNQSSWEIHELLMTPTSEENWSDNELGGEVIGSGETFNLHSIPCDEYWIQLTDEDGDACVLDAVKICSDKTLTIKDENLLKCQQDTE